MTTTAGTLRTADDYRQQAKWHEGNADAMEKVLHLYTELPDQMVSYMQGERNHHREQTIQCLKLALKIMRGE